MAMKQATITLIEPHSTLTDSARFSRSIFLAWILSKPDFVPRDSLFKILSNGIVIVVAPPVPGKISVDVQTFEMVSDEVQRAIPGEARVIRVLEAEFGTKTQFFTSILGKSWLIAIVITAFAPAHFIHVWAAKSR
ncbi:uncharacterized protein BJX67DRAFT_354551 [Aspergillus lucknowensis]|uniref:Uncharacterized protein n=1 Tax=Aspergillus lucknowensis TaxID=176173 RepID=A0ABR4LQ77_9EURO